MALTKTGDGVVDIRGSIGGVHFTRDRSGLHCSRAPRTVKKITLAQKAQRDAYRGARAYSTNNRFVSYNLIRIVNGLTPQDPPADYRADLQ